MARRKYQRYASTPKCEVRSCGLMPVRFDLDIFSPPTISQPLATTLPGSGSPCAISIAGQITEWKRRMSLPIRCTFAGNVLSNFSWLAP